VIEKLLKIDPDIKAIVSSGYSTDPIMANYRDYGFSSVLVKPYRSQEISKVLQELLTSPLR
jgi:CheY-like chemotaxis protein